MSIPENLMRKLQGIKDPRGPVGILARGKNIYPGGGAAQQGGGPQFGRPSTPNPVASLMNAKPQAEKMMAAARRKLSQRRGV